MHQTNPHLFTPYPIVHAFRRANTFIGRVVHDESRGTRRQVVHPTWLASVPTSFQSKLLSPALWNPCVDALSLLTSSELDSIADWTAQPINEWLLNHHYSIQLDPWSNDRRTFGFAAHLELIREWIEAGNTGYHLLDADEAAAFRLPADELTGMTFSLWDKEVVAYIPTSTPNRFVTITKMPHGNLQQFDLVEAAIDMRTGNDDIDFTGAIFPQWTFEEEVNVSWAKGIHTTDVASNHWKVDQAIFQGKSAFGAWGTGFKAAFAASAKRECAIKTPEIPASDWKFDYPLMYALWHEQSPVPFGVASIPVESFAHDDVQKPGKDW